MVTARGQWAILGLALFAIGLGMLAQIVFQPVVPDGSTRADTAPAARDAGITPGITAIQRMDKALAERDFSTAQLAWHAAYAAALRSRSSESMLEVGDAYLRIGEVTGARQAAEPRAREIYLAAFFRARAEGSLDGVLRAAEAFAGLGDHEVAQQGVRIAQRLVAQARDPLADERVQAFAQHLAARRLAAAGP